MCMQTHEFVSPDSLIGFYIPNNLVQIEKITESIPIDFHIIQYSGPRQNFLDVSNKKSTKKTWTESYL